jgi:serine acetyltransferase
MSLSAKLDKTFPEGIHVGPETYLAFESRVLSHDMTRGLRLHTHIGSRCFIGGRSLIMPGITIGDGCIVGAGSIVTKDVPPGTVVAGNPARVLATGVSLGPYGQLPRQREARTADVVESPNGSHALSGPRVMAQHRTSN